MSAVVSPVSQAGIFAWQIRTGICRGFGARHVNLALAFSFAYAILGHLGWPDFDIGSLEARLKLFAAIPGYLMVAIFALLVAVAMENLLTRSPLRRLRYPLAVLFAGGIGVVLGGLFIAAAGRATHAVTIAGAWAVPALLTNYLKATYICALVVSLHAIFEANRLATANLHAAQLLALDADHELFADELRAIQARVDPDLLFESLRGIDAAYERDPAAGQAQLDALIRFLRAALPGDLAADSTIANEKELIEAYVALVSFQRPSQPHLEFVADAGSLEERLPPMLLLPLVRWALGDGSVDQLSVRVARREEGSKPQAVLEIVIDSQNDRPSTPADEELAIARARLQRLYGGRASCHETADATQRRLVVAVPLDRARTGEPPAD